MYKKWLFLFFSVPKFYILGGGVAWRAALHGQWPLRRCTMHLEFNTEIDLISDHFTDFLLIKNYNWHFGGLLVMLLDKQTKT